MHLLIKIDQRQKSYNLMIELYRILTYLLFGMFLRLSKLKFHVAAFLHINERRVTFFNKPCVTFSVHFITSATALAVTTTGRWIRENVVTDSDDVDGATETSTLDSGAKIRCMVR